MRRVCLEVLQTKAPQSPGVDHLAPGISYLTVGIHQFTNITVTKSNHLVQTQQAGRYSFCEGDLPTPGCRPVFIFHRWKVRFGQTVMESVVVLVTEKGGVDSHNSPLERKAPPFLFFGSSSDEGEEKCQRFRK